MSENRLSKHMGLLLIRRSELCWECRIAIIECAYPADLHLHKFNTLLLKDLESIVGDEALVVFLPDLSSSLDLKQLIIKSIRKVTGNLTMTSSSLMSCLIP